MVSVLYVHTNNGELTMNNLEIAQIIIEQLGNGRFAAMTGAKNFVAIKYGLQFDLPRKTGFVKDGINRIHIIVKANDTYTVKGLKYMPRKMEVKEIASEEMIYCDMLTDTFEEMTGLYLYL